MTTRLGDRMYLIRAKNACEAWIQAVRHIWNKGKIVYDKDEKLKEILNLVLEIKNPVERNENVEKLIPKESIQEIMDLTFKKERNPRWGYSYGERLFDFKGVNQVQWAIDRLNENPNSKSTTIGILMPEIDTKAEHIPCMNLLDFKKRDRRLHLTVLFRSHDYGRKALPNFIVLGKLLKQVSEATNSEIGKIVCHSISAHIYGSEFERINRIISELF